MTKKQLKLAIISGIVAVTIGSQALAASVASAHNAGHVSFPDGTCLDVGSGKSAPLVGENNPHYHQAADADQGRLDLIEGPGDQYGARFAATRGNSRVLPGECP